MANKAAIFRLKIDSCRILRMSQIVMEELLLKRLLCYVILNHVHEFNSYLTADIL